MSRIQTEANGTALHHHCFTAEGLQQSAVCSEPHSAAQWAAYAQTHPIVVLLVFEAIALHAIDTSRIRYNGDFGALVDEVTVLCDGY